MYDDQPPRRSDQMSDELAAEHVETLLAAAEELAEACTIIAKQLRPRRYEQPADLTGIPAPVTSPRAAELLDQAAGSTVDTRRLLRSALNALAPGSVPEPATSTAAAAVSAPGRVTAAVPTGSQAGLLKPDGPAPPAAGRPDGATNATRPGSNDGTQRTDPVPRLPDIKPPPGQPDLPPLTPPSLNPPSLNPSSLNPSSLNPSSLNPSSLNLPDLPRLTGPDSPPRPGSGPTSPGQPPAPGQLPPPPPPDQDWAALVAPGLPEHTGVAWAPAYGGSTPSSGGSSAGVLDRGPLRPEPEAGQFEQPLSQPPASAAPVRKGRGRHARDDTGTWLRSDVDLDNGRHTVPGDIPTGRTEAAGPAGAGAAGDDAAGDDAAARPVYRAELPPPVPLAAQPPPELPLRPQFGSAQIGPAGSGPVPGAGQPAAAEPGYPTSETREAQPVRLPLTFPSAPMSGGPGHGELRSEADGPRRPDGNLPGGFGTPGLGTPGFGTPGFGTPPRGPTVPLVLPGTPGGVGTPYAPEAAPDNSYRSQQQGESPYRPESPYRSPYQSEPYRQEPHRSEPYRSEPYRPDSAGASGYLPAPGYVPAAAPDEPSAAFVRPTETMAPADPVLLATTVRQVEGARRHLLTALLAVREAIGPNGDVSVLTAVEHSLATVTGAVDQLRGALQPDALERVLPGEARFSCTPPWQRLPAQVPREVSTAPATVPGATRILIALGYDAAVAATVDGQPQMNVAGPGYRARVVLQQLRLAGTGEWQGYLDWHDASGTPRSEVETLGPAELTDDEVARRVDDALRRRLT